ncbi:GNAT family N-acetyltransferase [Aminobacter aminovorans]|uniref:Acetyltransferase, N-acetylglutamate synthase n=1 Tax=Aminobacter aminovorans TaxID=83263 RepID=A0AAC8YPC6_AMIAI|nr:GNAT family N-acetyltransferase [Aminobacter aminovorans]AMS41801.1 Acetyltransferase, N-acetylglutamate synthase [Aminobacter aminovorans]MBB3703851.1 ribosomal protein S18 acetylase RimI-like enzyme [Aminobacter aminovorans]WMC95128.1 GNAT family N-acetyltransferase [Aminobacter aminovorans]
MKTDPEPLGIRPLIPTDASAVRDLYDRAADFVLLESGTEPTDQMVADFFTDHPPGSDLAASCKLGMFLPGGTLVAIADMAFGYPETDDAYVGLLLIDQNCRGVGLGRTFLDHLTATAQARNGTRLLIAVLDENTRGRAFWEREGFWLVQSIPNFKIGLKTHVVHRMWRPL